jgi:predicted DCC family thiol-disulfide oxidoreductase YuxK
MREEGVSADVLLVPFDGACPVCRREMAHYQQLRPLRPLHFVDLSRGAPLPPDAPPPERLLARLHARLPDGRWVQGAGAFVALWACLPGWRWLARGAALPGALPLLDLGYAGFLRLRGLWRRPAACELPPR